MVTPLPSVMPLDYIVKGRAHPRGGSVQNPDSSALYLQSSLAEQGHGLGQQLPLTVLHDPPLQDLRGIVGQHFHRLLGDDGAAVALLGDKMYRRTRQLDPVLQRLLVDMESVAAGTAKEGSERGEHSKWRWGRPVPSRW